MAGFPYLRGMESYEWRERTEEGLRFWRANFHAGKWDFKTTLKTDPDWEKIDPVPRDLWVTLRQLLFNKYQRKRIPWKWIEDIDKLIESMPDDSPKAQPQEDEEDQW